MVGLGWIYLFLDPVYVNDDYSIVKSISIFQYVWSSGSKSVLHICSSLFLHVWSTNLLSGAKKYFQIFESTNKFLIGSVCCVTDIVSVCVSNIMGGQHTMDTGTDCVSHNKMTDLTATGLCHKMSSDWVSLTIWHMSCHSNVTGRQRKLFYVEFTQIISHKLSAIYSLQFLILKTVDNGRL